LRGGFGNPFERDAERARADVLNELVSREAAERDYGVVLTADGSVDEKATSRHRRGPRGQGGQRGQILNLSPICAHRRSVLSRIRPRA